MLADTIKYKHYHNFHIWFYTYHHKNQCTLRLSRKSLLQHRVIDTLFKGSFWDLLVLGYIFLYGLNSTHQSHLQFPLQLFMYGFTIKCHWHLLDLSCSHRPLISSCSWICFCIFLLEHSSLRSFLISSIALI